MYVRFYFVLYCTFLGYGDGSEGLFVRTVVLVYTTRTALAVRRARSVEEECLRGVEFLNRYSQPLIALEMSIEI